MASVLKVALRCSVVEWSFRCHRGNLRTTVHGCKFHKVKSKDAEESSSFVSIWNSYHSPKCWCWNSINSVCTSVVKKCLSYL